MLTCPPYDRKPELRRDRGKDTTSVYPGQYSLPILKWGSANFPNRYERHFCLSFNGFRPRPALEFEDHKFPETCFSWHGEGIHVMRRLLAGDVARRLPPMPCATPSAENPALLEGPRHDCENARPLPILEFGHHGLCRPIETHRTGRTQSPIGAVEFAMNEATCPTGGSRGGSGPIHSAVGRDPG